ncbi:MAG: hypothetical protein AMXMBFR33_52050 [Candidatus Xenobia bacterium]
MKLLNTIRSRLVLTYLLLVSLSLGISAGFMLRWMQSSLERRAENQLTSQSRVLAHFMNMYTQHPDDLSESARWVMHRFPRLTRARIRIADQQGKILGDSLERLSEPMSPEALKALEGQPITWFSTEDGVRVAHASTPIELQYPTVQRVGVVDVASNLSELDDTYRELKDQLLTALGLALLGSVLAAMLLAATLTRPLERIRQTAARIAEGHLQERVEPSGTLELSQLGTTINHMAGQLSRQLGELLAERNKIGTLLASIPDGVVAVDAAGNMTYLNAAAEAALRLDRWEGQPLPDALAFPPEPQAQEVHLQERIYRALVVPFRDEGGQIGRLLLLRDITDVRRLEEMRNLFLSSVSHELRTPLTIIKGFAATLLESCEDESLKKPLTRIDTEADRLTRLVQDLLELTRLRSLSLSMDLAPILPEEVVEDVVDLLRPQAERNEVKLSFQPHSEARPMSLDRDRLKQVVINLVDNALKFTPGGGTVTVRTSLESGRWRLEVEDTGPGIPKEDLPLLFDHFFRSKDTTLRSVKGTGLGLAIVKEIVERHGGEVEASSVVGQGTCLCVVLPVGP